METSHRTQWDDLIQPGMVHGSLYYDEMIFKEEVEKIWFKTWVYVGHESEVPNKNDFVTKSIGPDVDGEVAFEFGGDRKLLRARGSVGGAIAADTDVVIERVEADVAYVEAWADV